MACVSKDGGLHDRRPRPSFETHRSCDAPQDEVRGRCRYDSNFEIVELVALILSDTQEVWITFDRGRYQQTCRVNCRALMSLRRYRQVSFEAAGMATVG